MLLNNGTNQTQIIINLTSGYKISLVFSIFELAKLKQARLKLAYFKLIRSRTGDSSAVYWVASDGHYGEVWHGRQGYHPTKTHFPLLSSQNSEYRTCF